MILLEMPEDRRKANLVLRAVAKLMDFLLIAAAMQAIPQVGYIAGVVYLLISDGLFDGRSIGKKIIRLRVISVPGESSGTFRDSMIRNLTLAVPLLLLYIPFFGWIFMAAALALEFLLLLGNEEGMRLGDDLAQTKVIEG
ncbi:MAG: RDD family protein [Nitrospirales bacterium]|nr:RDD family protein [Nitrospirales bacterium]